MWKFALKSILFLIIGLILLHGLARLANDVALTQEMEFTVNEQKRLEKVLSAPSGIEAVIFGNSHAAAVDPKQIGVKGLHLNRPGSDLFEVQYYIHNIVPRLPDLKIVLIPISYFSFERDNAAHDYFEIRRIHLYSAAPFWNFIKGDEKNFLIGKFYRWFPIDSVIRDDNWQTVWINLQEQFRIGPAQANKLDVNQIDNSDRAQICTNYRTPEVLIENGKSKSVGTIRANTVMTAGHPHLQQDTLNALIEIVEFLEQRNIQVILFTPPYARSYTDSYLQNDPNGMQLMKQNLTLIQEQYAVKYYDFSTDSDFVENHIFFKDSDHFNECGTAKFSAKFKDIITGTDIEY